ncbi:hypothetical protein ACNKHX_04830 [Shigella flexneri]
MVIPNLLNSVLTAGRHRLRSDWLYRNRRRRQMGLSLYRHELYRLRRVMLAALEGGRDATSGKVFLPQEKALSAGDSTISMK